MTSRIFIKPPDFQGSGSITSDSHSLWDDIPKRLHRRSIPSSDSLFDQKGPHASLKTLLATLLLILAMMSCKLSPKQIAQKMVSETTTAQYQFDMAIASAIAKTENAKSSTENTDQPGDIDIQPHSSATPIPALSPNPNGTSITDTEVTILEWEMGKGIDFSTFKIRQPTPNFGGQDTVYIIVHTVVHSSSSPSYRGEWYDSSGMLWLIEEGPLSIGESLWYLSADPPSPSDWPLGEYEVRLSVDGQQIFSWSFTVED
jgi:hypothetical protein